MKITVESTNQVVNVMIGDVAVPGRVWEGTTDDGVMVQVLITRVAVAVEFDHSQFVRELIETPLRPPSHRAFDAELIP